jgi:hypothetical protein
VQLLENMSRDTARVVQFNARGVQICTSALPHLC